MSQIFKNFDIKVSGVNNRNTFSNGDTVEGEFSFDLTKATKISSIIMRLEGEAAVQWSSGGGWSQQTVFSSTKELLHLKHVIMQEDTSRMYTVTRWLCLGVVLLNKHPSFLTVQFCPPFAGTDGSVELEPGTHKYPFSLQLPDGCV